MMYWYGDHVNGWGYGLGVLSTIAFWGLLIAAAVILIRYLAASRREPPASPPAARPPGDSRADGPKDSTAERLLAERFARGEIDADEYRERLAVLHEHSRPSAGTPG